MDLEFDWDDRKAAANLKKHGISFEDASRVFFGVGRIEKLDDRGDYREDRFVTTGMSQGRLLTVAYTERDEGLRLISARRATRDEEHEYYENQS